MAQKRKEKKHLKRKIRQPEQRQKITCIQRSFKYARLLQKEKRIQFLSFCTLYKTHCLSPSSPHGPGAFHYANLCFLVSFCIPRPWNPSQHAGYLNAPWRKKKRERERVRWCRNVTPPQVAHSLTCIRLMLFKHAFFHLAVSAALSLHDPHEKKM